MAINQNIKKKIAKEIIYFFSAVVLLILIGVVAAIRNNSLGNKIDLLNKKYALLESEIDSIEKTYPKEAKSFNELMQIKDNEGWVDVPISDDSPRTLPADFFSDANRLDYDALPPDIDIYNLYDYLRKKEFDFSVPNAKWTPPKNAIPICKSFEKEISQELENTNKPFIKKIYSFLKNKNDKFIADTSSFFCFLQGLPEPPSHEIYSKVSELKKEKDETYAQYKKTSDKRIDVDDLMQGMVALFFSLLYPIRFIFLLLMWAVKTVKQKE